MSLTKSDKIWVENLFDRKTGSKMEELEEKFESMLIEFKSEFFDKIDPILKEVTIAQDERTLLENRVEKLEEIHTSGKHALASQ
jgi:hypothetical protein